jgi:hypothetical protein
MISTQTILGGGNLVLLEILAMIYYEKLLQRCLSKRKVHQMAVIKIKKQGEHLGEDETDMLEIFIQIND